ncbi:phytase [Marivirga sp. S37H4]|uniref:Phytase n=1 Tax=Marivirga aurantiaca TaxID=2802615 RepID=A0A935CBL8_9BACT|nr:phytase [Marivirga aurantiaca]MBK6265438.1 phytase [Marivirga aurantiaca]
MKNFLYLIIALNMLACGGKTDSQETASSNENPDTLRIQPKYVTQPVISDTDDPAIWINKANPSESLIIGTDKGDDGVLGGLYVYNLKGEIDREKSITDLERPNNVDVAYGMPLNGDTIDIAVFTERYTNSIRIFQLPEMKEIDNGGIPVFEDDTLRSPMGVALYPRPSDQKIFAVVGRKEGPTDGTYLYQYELMAENGVVKGELVRKFGIWSGEKEIEAIVADNEAGYVYFSDERKAIAKYYADPAKGNEEIARFGQKNFLEDREGLSIYKKSDTTGYLLVSDQSDNTFHVFKREGNNDFITELPFSTKQSDGNEVVNYNFGEEFPEGIFVAMSDDKTFQIYDWRDIQKAIDKANQK